MTKRIGTERLAFKSINSAGMVELSDGSYWKVSPDGGKIVRMWRKADLVEVKANSGSWDWAFRIVHIGKWCVVTSHALCRSGNRLIHSS
ncbi:hypothetical protein PMI02_00060 [Novosphingobium sp. AP12]|nr:hypothetical protein PMI02_00060 [Novosphingobium sp. AP12]